MYRSLGRMFIVSNNADLISELKDNAKTISSEQERYANLKKTYEQKKEHYTKTLQELLPK